LDISSLAKKLKIKENYATAILSAPSDYLKLLEPLPAGVRVDYELKKKYDFVQYFVVWKKDFDSVVPKIKQAIKLGGLIWITYPKGTSKVPTDLNRDKLFEYLAKEGLKAVAQIAIDPVWSAMRFKPLK